MKKIREKIAKKEKSLLALETFQQKFNTDLKYVERKDAEITQLKIKYNLIENIRKKYDFLDDSQFEDMLVTAYGVVTLLDLTIHELQALVKSL